ncbi:DUF1059 domain-containing protein [Aquipuribacter hungaricus]|uniref:DUF1059 domain-containing protein n=1 Tax=Aquipuribacter hungaricus TaxID=545624 RepID=A0ABV7WNY9_9MICO
MKRFRCGDVIPGCTAQFAGTEEDILAQVGAHARRDHGVADVGPELVVSVRAALQDVH